MANASSHSVQMGCSKRVAATTTKQQHQQHGAMASHLQQ